MTGKLPLVSVIMPIRNEAALIGRVIASILRQADSGIPIELLAIDGMSDDGTRSIIDGIRSSDGRVRLIDNPRRTTPCAMNIGLRSAAGELVAILGAHSVYADDYIRVCAEEMTRAGAVACSGRIECTAATDDLAAMLALWVMSSPFGSSPRSFRTHPEGYADSVGYPVAVKQALLDVGGYDEQLTRNQDNDMNKRLRDRGHKLYYTWRTSVSYRAPGSIRALMQYAFRNGLWNGYTTRLSPGSLGIIHFVPAVFFSAVTAAAVVGVAGYPAWGPLSFALLAAALAMHAAAGFASAAQVLHRTRDARALLLPGPLLAFHLTYGLGTIVGLLRAKPLENPGK